jgi:hypothetical protein
MEKEKLNKDELKNLITTLKVEAFPVGAPANGAKYQELKDAEKQLKELEQKEENEKRVADFDKAKAEREKIDEMLKAGMLHPIYKGSF